MPFNVTIKEVNVEHAPNGKKYQIANVVYDFKGTNKTTKIFSYANPAVFDALKGIGRNVTVAVETAPSQDGKYQNWSKVTPVAADEAGPPFVTTQGPVNRVVGSNYETPAERAKRQVYIVKQSSISSAIELLTTGAKVPPATDEVLRVAQQFVEFVFDAGYDGLEEEGQPPGQE